jgi:Protein of unknown function (DUF1573)
MKRIFILITSFLLAINGTAQQPDVKQGRAVMTWEVNSFDFGDIFQGDKIEHTFKFANTGTEPLIITNVTTQCGCTAPKGWPRDPVLPGGKGEITLSFNSAGKYGRQNKVATIISNAGNSDGGQLILSGNVLEKKPQ